MQTSSNLQIPTLNANAVAAPKVNLNLSAGGAEYAFKQALSREMDQRQADAGNANAPAKAADRPAASRSSAPKPAAPAKPAQQQNTQADAADQAKPAAAAANEAPAAPAPANTAASDSENSAADSAASDAQAAQSADPVADMLALVAAFNQPAPASAPAADGADTTIASATAGAASAASLAADAAAAAALATSAAASAATDTDAAATAATGTRDAGKAALDAAARQVVADDVPDTDADRALFFKDGTGTAASAAQAAAVAAAAATKAATAAPAAVPVAPQAVATEIKTNVKPAATPADEPSADAVAATDGAAPKTRADVINRIETKAAPTDDKQPQLTQTQQQQAEPQLAAGTPAKTTANTEFTAALQEAGPAAIAPTAARAAQEIAKAATAVPTDKLSSRVGSQGWDQQLGQKIIFMAAGGEQSATMELNPPDLGPLQVVLSVNKDQATAAFSSATPEVRQALEAALPKLKEMMSEAGIQLGSATVSAGMSDQNNSSSQQASSAQGGNGNGGSRSSFGRDGGAATEAPRSAPPARRVPAGAVDTFA